MSTPVDLTNAPAGQTAGYFQAFFTSKWGAAAGKAYAEYNASNPGNTPYMNAQAFADIVALEGLQKALTAVGTGVGTAQGQVITGAEKGAIQITSWEQGLEAVGRFFASLGEANTWIRIAKVLIGGVLLVVGLVHITGADNAVASAARKVPLPI